MWFSQGVAPPHAFGGGRKNVHVSLPHPTGFNSSLKNKASLVQLHPKVTIIQIIKYPPPIKGKWSDSYDSACTPVLCFCAVHVVTSGAMIRISIRLMNTHFMSRWFHTHLQKLFHTWQRQTIKNLGASCLTQAYRPRGGQYHSCGSSLGVRHYTTNIQDLSSTTI